MTRTPGEPSDAAQTLRELHVIAGRSRQAASTDLTRIPLAAWGLAWLIGYPLLALAPWSLSVPVGCLLAAVAVSATWIFRSRETISGRERRTRAGWLALLLCSPFLVAVVSPIPATVEVLFLGALWGVALLLYAIATSDRALGVVGMLIVLAAPGCRVFAASVPLLIFGVIAGSAMSGLGLWRSIRSEGWR